MKSGEFPKQGHHINFKGSYLKDWLLGEYKSKITFHVENKHKIALFLKIVI